MSDDLGILPAPRPWTADEDALLSTFLLQKPYPYDDVAQQLGRSSLSIKARVSRLRYGDTPKAPKSFGQALPRPPRFTASAFHKTSNKKSEHAGETTCLNCRAKFASWDVRKNRLCSKCSGGSEDPVHVRHTAKHGAQ